MPSSAGQFRRTLPRSGRARRCGGLFERAGARGELPGAVNVELLLDVVYGVLWYRLLVEHEPLDDAVARDLAALVTRAAASI